MTALPPLVTALRNTLVVSCQAYPGEPMRHPGTMAQVAASVEIGGAAAVRAQGLDDIRAVKQALDPQNLLNPGRVLGPVAGGTAPAAAEN